MLSRYMIVKESKLKFPKVETQQPSCTDILSAGDDFYSKETVTIEPNTSHLFWTDIKAHMQDDEVLYIFVRSSIGTKKHLMLANTVGVIDASYFGNIKNDGNIGIALHNYGTEAVVIEVDERIAQGVLQKFVSMGERNPLSDKRVGGFGSSDEENK